LHYDIDAWYFPRNAFEDELPTDVYSDDVEDKFDDPSGAGW